jgi:Rrf2 family transcriptional regulator, cysteine metabolism repressor
MIEIARLSNDSRPTSLERVAQSTQISRRYLEQLAIALKNARLLRGFSGKGGGYMLARPPEEVKVGQIIEAAIGPISIVDCVSRPELCLKTEICECRLLYVLINSRITQVLNEFSLADLVDKGWLRKMMRKLEPFDVSDKGSDDKRRNSLNPSRQIFGQRSNLCSVKKNPVPGS